MSALVFNDHPVPDLIRRNLNMAAVFVRAAGNQRRGGGAAIAAANAREAYDQVLALLGTLPQADQKPWLTQLLALDSAIAGFENAESTPSPEAP